MADISREVFSMDCPHDQTKKDGKQNGLQRHKCKGCGKVFTEKSGQDRRERIMQTKDAKLKSVKVGSISRLNDIVEQVNKLRAEYRSVLARGAAVAKETGVLLAEARKLMPKGCWSRWLATNLELTSDTAHRYITIGQKWERIESHKDFPNLNVVQMFDVARGKKPRTRSHKLCGRSLDTLLGVLEDRLAEHVMDCEEIEALVEAIDNARPALESRGLLKSTVSKRKASLISQRLSKAG